MGSKDSKLMVKHTQKKSLNEASYVSLKCLTVAVNNRKIKSWEQIQEITETRDSKDGPGRPLEPPGCATVVQHVWETDSACGVLKAEPQRAEMRDGICALWAEMNRMFQGTRVWRALLVAKF